MFSYNVKFKLKDGHQGIPVITITVDVHEIEDAEKKAREKLNGDQHKYDLDEITPDCPGV